MGDPEPVLIDVPEELDGPRVRLRPLRADDAPAVWEAIEESRAHLAPWVSWVHDLHSLDDERATIARLRARWVLRESLTVGIFDRATGRYLGGSGLHRIDWSVRAFEIGYWIRVTAEGRGYVAETVRVLAGFAFEALGANRVEIRTEVGNARSRKVAEILGFVCEGTLRRARIDREGGVTDTVVYALIPEDYARLPWRSTPPPGGTARGPG